MSINNQIKNQEKDPVCGMFVIVNSHTIQTHIRGKNYYFCNPNCLKTFLKPEKEFVNLKKLTGFSLILCSLTLLINFSDIIFNSLSISTLISKNHLLFIFSTPVQFISGNRFYKGFIHAIKARTANMDVLIVIGSSTAWLYSTLVTFFPILIPESSRVTYFDSGVVIITFLLLGKVLEHNTKRKTSDSIRNLFASQPLTAIVIRKNKEFEIPIELIKKGDVVIVKPGNIIPVDGNIMEGISNIDEKMMTGESLPITKSKGDKVLNGTMNLDGLLKVHVKKVGSNSLLGQIIKTLDQSSVSTTPIETSANKIVQYFIPVVIIISASSFGLWLLINGNIIQGLTAFISVLIIACPCALGLATPAAIIACTSKGAENGILLKSGDYIEKTNKLNTIVFDKTGTITKGTPVVINIIPLKNKSEHTILSYAAIAEKGSIHPLANAIINKALELNLKIPSPKQVEILSGLGVKSLHKNDSVLIGNPRLFSQKNLLNKKIKNMIIELEKKGETVVLISVNDVVEGLISISDEIRNNSQKTINDLKIMGFKIVLLSGDSYSTTKNIATKLGINEFFAEVLPNKKASIISKLQNKGNIVAMVGDGINDAPALFQSDVGITIGKTADITLETGNIIIMNNDIYNVVYSIKLGQKTLQKIKQNLFWAFLYNICLIPIAASGLLNPGLAAIAMVLSSLSVLINSLRIKYSKLS